MSTPRYQEGFSFRFDLIDLPPTALDIFKMYLDDSETTYKVKLEDGGVWVTVYIPRSASSKETKYAYDAAITAFEYSCKIARLIVW